MLYVGETCRQMNHRFGESYSIEYTNMVNVLRMQTAMYPRHYNLPGHSKTDWSVLGLTMAPVCNNKQRKTLEKCLVLSLVLFPLMDSTNSFLSHRRFHFYVIFSSLLALLQHCSSSQRHVLLDALKFSSLSIFDLCRLTALYILFLITTDEWLCPIRLVCLYLGMYAVY